MKRRGVALVAAVLAVAAALAAGRWALRQRESERHRRHGEALAQERAALRLRLGELLAEDKRLAGMPPVAVRFGIPTRLARTVIEQVATGFVDRVSLELEGLGVNAQGKVKKLVTLGEYSLHLSVHRLSGQLRTHKPEVAFGGNSVMLSLPVTVQRGAGRASLSFRWDGKHVADVVCGDVEIAGVEVDGTIEPDRYVIQGAFALSARANTLVATPSFPTTKISLKIAPSPESWDKVQAILQEQAGACKLVLERLNVPKLLAELLARGIKVRLPTEKLAPLALPIAIERAMNIRGTPITLGVKLGDIAITRRMVWLGVEVSVARAAPLP